MNRIGRAIVTLLSLAVLGAASAVGLLIRHGTTPNAPYVALGSSYAAGLGLGPRAPGSPVLCKRSLNGYPQQLARLTGLAVADMSCSGATMANVLNGGQYFQGPQIAAIGPDTKLVTLTAGGNDIFYIRDLFLLSYARRGGLMGFIVRHLWHGPLPAQARDFVTLQHNFTLTLQEIKHRAPRARVLVVSYPNALPPTGTCAQLGISAADAATLRGVADRLAAVTSAAAAANGVTLVDMASLSAGHDACSPAPWVNGAAPAQGKPFHPTFQGASATAMAILQTLKTTP